MTDDKEVEEAAAPVTVKRLVMKFNRDEFIAETCGSLGAALDCIDDLVATLNGYVGDDMMAGGYGSGCYGDGAVKQVLSILNSRTVREYIDIDS